MSPEIFTQLFTILGTVPRAGHADVVALPFVYALLSSKESVQYATVFRAVNNAARAHGVIREPEMIMSEFEMAIIKASKEEFPHVAISLCFFHLKQSMYRKIQEKGLQVAYNDENDRTVKEFTHKLAALAFVPICDVTEAFAALKQTTPAAMREYLDYFDATYVNSAPARGRRRPLPPRYAVHLWNQYDPTREGKAKTNNVSEGWHNRFRLLVNRAHPDLYTFIKELKKEQGDTEIAVVELSLGRKIKAAPKKKNGLTYKIA